LYFHSLTRLYVLHVDGFTLLYFHLLYLYLYRYLRTAEQLCRYFYTRESDTSYLAMSLQGF